MGFMMIIPILVIAFIPGLLWLSYIRYQDRAAPEPKYLVAFVFFLGMVSTLPASLGNSVFETLLADNFISLMKKIGFSNLTNEGATVIFNFMLFFLIVGPVEELSKFLVVRLSVYYHKEFNEPIDALVYCAAAALGFASLENVLYALKQGHEVLYLRALLSVPGHLLFSAIWGFGLARSRFAGKSVWPSLLLASFLHGLYNFVLIAFSKLESVFGPFGSKVGLFLVLPLMGIMAWMLQRRIVALQRTSGPFLEKRKDKEGLLPVTLSTLPPIPRERLRGVTRSAAPQAPQASTPPAPVASKVQNPPPAAAQNAPQSQGGWCPKCKTPSYSTSRFCGTCGAQVVYAPGRKP
jgi:RsiW-degrading membrane proteinase PrsW (M82 family)